jgi:hypothetical protein
MQKRIVGVFVVLVAVLAIAATAQAQASNPFVGTWKTNLAKSTYSPDPKPTVPGTVKMEAVGDGFKTTIDATDAQGKPTHTETTWKFDGKDNPTKGAAAPNTTAAYKRIDGRSFEVTGKVDGKPTIVTKVVVSADGKTITATQTGKNAQGQTVNNVIVGEKQ